MQNSPFLTKIATLRNRLPDWMEYTLLGVYIVSAGVGALFLNKLLFSTFDYWGTAFAIGIAVATQVVRLIVVFFDQLNPQRPAVHMGKSYIAAVALGGLAVYEAVELVTAAALPSAVTISIAGLMIVGIVIEIYVLRELQHATNYAFFSDPEKRKELENYYVQQAQFSAFMKTLREQTATGNFLPQSPTAAPSGQDESLFFSAAVLNAIGGAYKLNDRQMQEIRQAIKGKEDESEIIKMISAYSDINRGLEKKPTSTSQEVMDYDPIMDFSKNGNGVH